MHKLSYLIGRGSPCVLTTRPTYFELFNDFTKVLRIKLPKRSSQHQSRFNRAEIAKRLGISMDYEFPLAELGNAIAVKALSRESIELYLRAQSEEIRRATGYTYEMVIRFIFGVYDLEDLVQRPLLLDMVVRTIIHGSIDIAQRDLKFGPSELYEFYTLACAQRDAGKEEMIPFLRADDRLEACRRLAIEMFSCGTIILTNEQILSILRGLPFKMANYGGSDFSEFLPKALTDVRLCSFLTLDGSEALKFSHASFMEFFFAQAIVLNCNSNLEFLRQQVKQAAAPAVVYSLGSFARSQNDFALRIGVALDAMRDGNTSRERDDIYFDELVLRIAWASSDLLKNKHLRQCVIKNSRLAKSELSGTYLDRVALKELGLHESVLDGSRAPPNVAFMKLKCGTMLFSTNAT